MHRHRNQDESLVSQPECETNLLFWVAEEMSHPPSSRSCSIAQYFKNLSALYLEAHHKAKVTTFGQDSTLWCWGRSHYPLSSNITRQIHIAIIKKEGGTCLKEVSSYQMLDSLSLRLRCEFCTHGNNTLFPNQERSISKRIHSLTRGAVAQWQRLYWKPELAWSKSHL